MNSATALQPGPVFIVGMNGSGTTMLLDCLASHSVLYGYRDETKVLPYFIRRQARYGDLTQEPSFARLWNDLKSTFNRRRWPAGTDAPSSDSWGFKPRTAAAVFDSLMTSLANEENKQIWCEKTPMHVHHIALLADEFPRSRFIHVIRDGRDSAASFHRRWRFNPLRTIYRWKLAVRAGREQGVPVGSRYCEIHYEHLTADPEKCLAELCHFLEIPFEPGMLKPARVRPRMTGSSMAVISRNERSAGTYFDRQVLERMERIAGRVLNECGYVTQFPDSDEDPPSWKLKWWEMVDDTRRFREALRRAATLRRSERLMFLKNRIRGALKQKNTID